MEDLQTGDINLPPEYVNSHLPKLKKDFHTFKTQIDQELAELHKANKYLDKYNFDASGEGHVSVDSLSLTDLKLRNEIETKFSFSIFFREKNNRLYNRQQVYYSVQKEEERLYQATKTFISLDSTLAILQEMDKNDFVPGSFIIASLLDDIRYKIILLYEDVLDHDIPLNTNDLQTLVANAIGIYYSYLLDRPQTTISHSQLITYTSKVRDFITAYLNNFNPKLGRIRGYKEGDNPSDNLLLIHKLKQQLPPEPIDVIIGIRFGGIELPYIVKHFIYPNADVKLEKISNYSGDTSQISLKLNLDDLKHKNVLIVDDGITTARTLERLIETLKKKCDNIYFACLYYSTFKRIKHMQRENHGAVNLEQLKKCCVLRETNYTAPASKKTYTNKQGKFDKTKARVEAKAELGQTLFDTEIPIEHSGVKDKDTKKVFIACSLSYITESYDHLIHIRNTYQKHPNYEIMDDWLVNRIEKNGAKHDYKEVPGRNFLYEAVKDIQKSDVIVLFCPGPSAYVSSLFQFAAMREKEILIFYRKAEDIKVFKTYQKGTFVQIMQLKSQFKI